MYDRATLVFPNASCACMCESVIARQNRKNHRCPIILRLIHERHFVDRNGIFLAIFMKSNHIQYFSEKKDFEMNRIIFLIFIVIISGCTMSYKASIPIIETRVTLKYDKPYPLKTINPNSYLVVISDECEQYEKSQELLKMLKQRLKKIGLFQITDHIDNSRKSPTYVLNIHHFVASPIQKAKKAGIQDMHEIDNICEQSDVLLSFVSLFDPKFFEMKHVFMIKSLSMKTFESKGPKSFENKLSKQIVSQLADAISVSRKSIDAYLLPGMDLRAKRYLIQYNYSKAKKRFKSILPALDFSKKTLSHIKKQYKTWHRSRLRHLETDLINFYGFLLACEASEADPIQLQRIYKGYQKIFTLTGSSQLMKACAHALGRNNS